jgi:HSP20 family protein
MSEELELYDPFRVMKKSFFEDFFEPFQSMKFPKERIPLVNVLDKGDYIEIDLELPGLNKEDIDVDTNENYVKIEAKTKKEDKIEEKDYYRYELRANSFSRLVPMPQKIIPSQVTGKLEQGILKLKAPKLNPKKEEKNNKIKIE